MLTRLWLLCFYFSKEDLANLDWCPIGYRCKHQTGELFHMIWTWHLALNRCLFWDSSKSISTAAIFEVKEVNVSQYKLNSFASACLIARRLIVLKWKDETPPSYTQWIRDLMRGPDSLWRASLTIFIKTDNHSSHISRICRLDSFVLFCLDVAECSKILLTMGSTVYDWSKQTFMINM